MHVPLKLTPRCYTPMACPPGYVDDFVYMLITCKLQIAHSMLVICIFALTHTFDINFVLNYGLHMLQHSVLLYVYCMAQNFDGGKY